MPAPTTTRRIKVMTFPRDAPTGPRMVRGGGDVDHITLGQDQPSVESTSRTAVTPASTSANEVESGESPIRNPSGSR